MQDNHSIYIQYHIVYFWLISLRMPQTAGMLFDSLIQLTTKLFTCMPVMPKTSQKFLLIFDN